VNPAPSLYSDVSKMYHLYVKAYVQLKLRIKNNLNEIKALNKREGAG